VLEAARERVRSTRSASPGEAPFLMVLFLKENTFSPNTKFESLLSGA